MNIQRTLSQQAKGLVNKLVSQVDELVWDTAVGINLFYADYTLDRTAIFEEDWDTMLVLDGCRYDLFASRETPGVLDPSYSMASCSPEWMAANFGDRDLYDTVYTTSNPYSATYATGVFHAMNNLFETAWDDANETVLPGDVATAAIEAHRQYPDKRHLVHFMQPHYPFLGPAGEAVDHRGLLTDRESDYQAQVWHEIERDGPVSADAVKRAYAENLDIVLEHVEDVLDEISGRVVITADHGNLLGERGFPAPIQRFGHPRSYPVAELTKVPWNTVDVGPRRETISEPPVDSQAEHDHDELNEKLQALGYTS